MIIGRYEIIASWREQLEFSLKTVTKMIGYSMWMAFVFSRILNNCKTPPASPRPRASCGLLRPCLLLDSQRTHAGMVVRHRLGHHLRLGGDAGCRPADARSVPIRRDRLGRPADRRHVPGHRLNDAGRRDPIACHGCVVHTEHPDHRCRRTKGLTKVRDDDAQPLARVSTLLDTIPKIEPHPEHPGGQLRPQKFGKTLPFVLCFHRLCG